MFYKTFQVIYQDMLSSNRIAGYFNYQYLSKNESGFFT